MKFVPYEKLSKKKKREHDIRKRGDWGALSPVTRRPDNPKAYRRKKISLSDLDDLTGGTYLFCFRQIQGDTEK